MDKVRLGVIGLGNMGKAHCKYLVSNEVPNTVLTAVCDSDIEKIKAFKNSFGDSVPTFENYMDLYNSKLVDAVLIATPHYDHPQMTIDAFEKGLHVLVEKPAGVYTKQVIEMNEAAKKSGKVYSIMFCLRTNPLFKKVRDIVKSGELGELKRVNWVVTTWYRPQCYHDSSSWRSSWKGEGGGLLINQCPHNFDLLQWMVGMPTRIRSFVSFGKYYNIEVEDEVTAYMEFPNGATGTFIASTGETPGTNRLEIAGNMGNLIVENNTIKFLRNRISEREFNKINKESFMGPEFWECNVPVGSAPSGAIHAEITRNFSQAVLTGEELIAPGEEGIKGLEISNAIHMSTWTDDYVTLPIDHEKFYEFLKNKINK